MRHLWRYRKLTVELIPSMAGGSNSHSGFVQEQVVASLACLQIDLRAMVLKSCLVMDVVAAEVASIIGIDSERHSNLVALTD